jgi:hypothetical protein
MSDLRQLFGIVGAAAYPRPTRCLSFFDVESSFKGFYLLQVGARQSKRRCDLRHLHRLHTVRIILGFPDSSHEIHMRGVGIILRVVDAVMRVNTK